MSTPAPEQAAAAPEHTPHQPLSKVIVRRTAVAIALVLLLLVPSIALMAATGQPAASYSALGTLVGAVAVLAGGVRIGVLTSIVLALLAPLAIMSGLSPITGAALMALMTLVVGRMSLFGLHRAVMLVPIMLAWPMLAPVPWVPREALDKINELMSKRGMTLAQAIDASQHSGTSGSSSAAGPLKNAVSQALMEQRYDTTYLTWVVVFFFIGAIIPVILLPFVARKANMPKPNPTTHTRAEAMAYTVTISGLTAVATYYFLNHPKMTAGSFFIATILVLTQVGNDIRWRLTIERVIGTLLGVVLMAGLLKVAGGTTYVELLGFPVPLVLWAIGIVFGVLAIIAKFSTRQWVYFVLIVPTTACLNAFSSPQATDMGKQRLVDNLVGAALVILAALITLAAGRVAENRAAGNSTSTPPIGPSASSVSGGPAAT